MVRTYKRKRADIKSNDVLWKALDHYNSTSDGYKKTSQLYGVPRSTLQDYVRKYKMLPESHKSQLTFGYQKPRQVFTDDQENIIVAYLKHAASIYFGLCPIEVRQLAYECAKKFEIKMPASWPEKELAGADWFTSFLKRHSGLSLRTPEATSIARATAFNRINVSDFFSKLSDVMDRYKIDAYRICNVDETGIITVVKPKKVLASTGMKQIGALTSAERGQLVTLCAAISASGNTIPPFLVYPRVNFRDHFLTGAPAGSMGTAHQSGWMTAENFLIFMKHFVRHVKPNKDKPVVILLDNHDSHLSIDALDYAKENGIVMLSFSPHCSHRLQPLDLSVFGPLKRKLSVSQSNWLRNNPGKPISIYDIAGILLEPWKSALSMTNICSGFQKAGIVPFNSDIFTDDDFMPADVTDRPLEATPDNAHTMTAQVDQVLDSSNDTVVYGNTDSEQAGCNQTDRNRDLNRYLLDHKISAIPVSGDGHCLLYAVSSSLHAAESSVYTEADLGKCLADEIRSNQQFYRDFMVTGDDDIMVAVQKYIEENQFNNNMCDLFLNALCNALFMKAVVIREVNGVISELVLLPGKPGVQVRRTIYLILQDSDANAHYSGAVRSGTIDDNVSSAIQIELPTSVDTVGSNTNNSTYPSTPISNKMEFTPDSVKPHPKAPARKNLVRNRKRRKTCILTDTPEKEALRLEQEKRKSKQKNTRIKPTKITKPRKGQSKPTKPVQQSDKTKGTSMGKSINQRNENSDSEDECFCLVCLESWSNSRSNEEWIDCTVCKMWAHEECADTTGMLFYKCHNCDSDAE